MASSVKFAERNGIGKTGVKGKERKLDPKKKTGEEESSR